MSKEKFYKNKKVSNCNIRYITNFPLEILQKANIHGYQKDLLTILWGHCATNTECTVSQELLSKEIGRSVRQLQRYIRELVSKGLIKIIRRGLGLCNKYILKIKQHMQKYIEQKSEEKKKEAELQNKAKQIESKIKERCNYYSSKSKLNSTFNNFKQRNYDFQDLKNKLLGWDKL